MASYAFAGLFCAIAVSLISRTDQVTVLQSVKASEFLNRFVSDGKPALLKDHLNGLEKSWPNLEALTKLPDTYMTLVDAEPSTGSEISLWEFFSRYVAENLRLYTPVPQSYRYKMEIPKILSCLEAEETKLKMLLAGGSNNRAVREISEDTLICQWVGELSFALKGEKDSKVQEKDQELKTLSEKDCAFIPKGSFIHTKSKTSSSWSVLLTWATIRNNEDCDVKQPRQTLGQYAPSSIDNTKFSLLQYIIASFVVNNDYDKDELIDAFGNDSITGNMLKSSEQTQSVIEEIFEILDINADGAFNKDDFMNLTRSKLNEMAETLTSRLDSPSQAEEDTEETDVEIDEGDKNDVKDKIPGMEKLSLESLGIDMNSLFSDAFGSALKEVMHSEDFQKLVLKELETLKEKGVDVEQASEIWELLKQQHKDGEEAEEKQASEEEGKKQPNEKKAKIEQRKEEL